jgi:hypothetical protein
MGVLKSLARKVGAGAARFAKRRITGALDSASDALENAVFGERAGTEGGPPTEAPEDPFAKLKEKERKENGKVR